MNAVSQDVIATAVAILGESDISLEEIELRIADLVSDPLTARRLIDCIPEAFGLALLPHIGKPVLPTTFSAQNRNGRWISFPFSSEPIFVAALQIAQTMFQNGSRETFQMIANRSSMIHSVDSALKAGVSIDGATFSGPAFLGIPAEIYPEVKKTFWQRLFPWF